MRELENGRTKAIDSCIHKNGTLPIVAKESIIKTSLPLSHLSSLNSQFELCVVTDWLIGEFTNPVHHEW